MATPDWVDVVVDELSRLENPHREKKRLTILALVDAKLAGKPEESVWSPRRTETCSRQIYHGKWKKDPLFMSVLAAVEAAARRYQDGKAARALATAAERLALASPVAVTAAIQALQSKDENVKLRAAFGVLDRAGVESAVKSSSDGQIGEQAMASILPEDEQEVVVAALKALAEGKQVGS